MFLESQIWFYDMYFTLTDFFKLLTITWDPNQKVLLFKNQRYWNSFIYAHLLSTIVYMIRATYLFLPLIMVRTSLSSSLHDICFHIGGLSCGWYLLLYRIMYTHRTSDLVCLINTIFSFEEGYISGKLFYSISYIMINE